MKDSGKKISVLIVESDPGELFIFQNAISELNSLIDVDLIHSAQQLTEFLLKDKLQRDLNRQVIPDLVLVNQRTRTADLDSVEKIRSYSEFKELPIYLFSGIENDQVCAEAALEAGITGVYKKPYTFYDLKPIIAKILQKCRLMGAETVHGSKTPFPFLYPPL